MNTDRVLSQEEIDALLEMVSKGEFGPRETQGDKVREVRLYDFTRPGRVSKDYIRSLQMLHRHFARVFSSSLSSLLRTLVDVECTQVEQLTYGDFLMSISEMSCLAIFSMEPLKGVAVMEISPQLVFPIIDRLLGGTGANTPAKMRKISEIEKAIIERAIESAMESLQEAWQYIVEDVKVKLERIETDPQYVQIVPSSDTVMLVIFEAKFNQAVGVMSICYPFTMIEPSLSSARPERWMFNYEAEANGRYVSEIRQKVEKTEIPVRVYFPPSKITLGDLLQLKEGDIIKTEVRVKEGKLIDPVIIEVGGKKRFWGKPGRVGRRKAVKIIGVIPEDEGR
ncbi:flagellar motor switch protein FliM [Candidatus Poribacteria bacterium]|nr:MAG: flagellar motor switch protein FliM [Candidatus Poribacteria bacterium]